MKTPSNSSRQQVVHRIFMAQVGLIIALLLLVVVGYFLERNKAEHTFGFFWAAFIVGCMGSSVGVLKRMGNDARLVEQMAASTIATLMPLLYGGIMASVAYLLFMSQILTGEEGRGLLVSNLFPDFTRLPEAESLSIGSYIRMRPVDLDDLGKLLVWSFVAGYSEKFVTRVLAQLEERK